MILYIILFLVFCIFLLNVILLSITKSNKDIIEYLQKVYPLMNLNNANPNKFYNNLSFFYNPCSKYWEDDLSGINTNPYQENTPYYNQIVCGTTWNSLNICNYFPSPPTPIGNFLSFYHYHKYNTPSVYSDGSDLLKNWTSYRQTLHWGFSSNGGEISRNCRSGPGPYWIKSYSLIRDMYYPNGIHFKNGQWTVKCNFTGNNHGCQWNYPKNWTNGRKEGEYIEVTHAQNSPGMPQSVGCWFNAIPGTGVYLKIGKTHVANNKVDALFTLVDKLSKSSTQDLQVQGTKFEGLSGYDILQSYYNTTDPYAITWGYINGEWPIMAYTSNRYPLVDPTNIAWKYIGNKAILSASGLMRDGNNIYLSQPDGRGYTPNLTTTFEEIGLWWIKMNDIQELNYDSKKLVVDAARNPSQDIDYFPNRAGAMVTPDEPICWISFLLGIETIQMPLSANDNGLWVYEIVDIRIPTPENTEGGLPAEHANWLHDAKERVYSFTIGYSNNWPGWVGDAQGWWMTHIEKFLSIRNPLNLDEGINCKGIGYINGLNQNQCENNPFPEVYTNMPYEILDNGGYYDQYQRCWVTIPYKGWQNLPCHPYTLAQQYVKTPLVYPATLPPFISKIEEPSEDLFTQKQTYIKTVNSKYYLKNIKYQNGWWNPKINRLLYGK